MKEKVLTAAKAIEVLAATRARTLVPKSMMKTFDIELKDWKGACLLDFCQDRKDGCLIWMEFALLI